AVVVLDAGRVAAERHGPAAAVVGVVLQVMGARMSPRAMLEPVAVAGRLDRRHEEVVPDVGVVAGVPQLGVGAVLLRVVEAGVVGDRAVRVAQEERDAVALVAVDHVVADVDARGRAAAVDDDAAAFRRRRAVALVRGTADEAAADRLAGEAGRALVVALARAVVALAGGSGVVERVRVADGPAVADGTVGFPATGLAGVVAVETRERRMRARVLARLRHAEARRRVAVVVDPVVPQQLVPPVLGGVVPPGSIAAREPSASGYATSCTGL